MHLVIDIGNSSLKFAFFEGTELFRKGNGIEALSALLGHSAAAVSGAIMASVADSSHATDLLRKFKIPFTTLSAQTGLPIRNLYHTPATLGSDRIALAVAAARLYSGPALVIGAGTCITYDFTEHGSYYGGAIAPGITMRFRALNHYTARLPYVDWAAYQDRAYDRLTGTDSESAILSGVLNGIVHEIDGTIEQYRQRYSGLRVAVTGGDMAFLVKNLKNDIFARPDMVLEGLNYILLHHA